ncbi:uncharacterized protein [Thunnus thynnus]|uniref:uncharacterized protein n=1 Tax=Thunnus thynnus TaxID=8237 RepID=UPI0035283563
MTDETPSQPLLSTTTTTMTQNKITTTERDSTSTEISTSAQLTTPELDQTTSISVNPNIESSTELESTTGHLSTDITSSQQPSTPEVDQAGPTTGVTPNQPFSTITTVTENKITTERDATSTYIISFLPFSTPEQNHITSIPVQTLYKSHYSNPATVKSNKRTTSEVDSTTGHLRTMDQTRPITQHVIKLGVTLTSKRQLSEDDIKDLVLVQFHNLLIEMGLPKSIKVSLKRPVK